MPRCEVPCPNAGFQQTRRRIRTLKIAHIAWYWKIASWRGSYHMFQFRTIRTGIVHNLLTIPPGLVFWRRLLNILECNDSFIPLEHTVMDC